jgi:hypothetical protein
MVESLSNVLKVCPKSVVAALPGGWMRMVPVTLPVASARSGSTARPSAALGADAGEGVTSMPETRVKVSTTLVIGEFVAESKNVMP